MSHGFRSSASRCRGVASALLFGVVIAITDLLSPRLRYGYAHRLSRALLRADLPSVYAPPAQPACDGQPAYAHDTAISDTTCVLASGHLDFGGVASVVEMLACHLPSAGVRPVVVCGGEGIRAERLRKQGIEVVSVTDGVSALAAIREVDPDVVQIHGVPPYLELAAMASGVPLVPVLHNTEIHYTRGQWARFARLLAASAASVAVSETVRQFHARHVPADLAGRIRVIPNGAATTHRADSVGRLVARQELERVLRRELGDEPVFLCLARYDAQKNTAGTVASFLRAAERGDEIGHLVIAGEPSDWAEVRRTAAIRRSSPHGTRVHLLANSHAETLLAAADAFVLNSFFEGWPVAATEALAAGLPLVLSEFGGATELVAADHRRSILVPNACGPADEVTDARVRAARRRARHQANSEAFESAILAMVASVRRRAGTAAMSGFHAGAMAEAHARAIRDAAQSNAGQAELSKAPGQ